MKILHIGKYFPPFSGGMENYLRDLMVSLSKRGIDSAALVHQTNIGLRSRKENFPAGEQTLPITRAAVWIRLLFTPVSPTFPLLMNRAIREEQAELLHLHMPNASVFWALFLPRARKIPWVIHWHSDVLASQHSLGLRLFYQLYRPFERAVLARSKVIIATSPPYLDSSISLQDYRDKCHVVPLGLDPEHYPASPPVRATNDNGAPMHILAIGRLTYYKGFDYLIRAMATVQNATLELVGKGDEEARLRTLVKQLGLEDRITFCGHLSPQQLGQAFARADCLCLPSLERTEAFGLVLLEAMQSGLPTVISDVPGSGMGWVVDEGVTGLKVPPKNEDKLASALQSLQQDRARMRTLGEQGREKFLQLFHIDKSAAGVARLYMKASGNDGSTPERPAA
ncbi:MAG: glycosyltransferase [Halioglobus sp.]